MTTYASPDVQALNPPELPDTAGTISHGVLDRSTGLVHVSGQVAWDADRVPVGVGDLAAQFHKAYENVDHVLAAAGTSRAAVIDETIYLVDALPTRTREVLGLMRAARPAGAVAPASTLVGVTSLFSPDFLVEIAVVATL